MVQHNPRGTMRLGDILLAAGLITPKQLQTALDQQKRTGDRLGEVLVSLGFVTEFDMGRVLADQLGYPFIANPLAEMEPGIAAMISEEMARKYTAIPLRMEGTSLVVALADPLNFLAVDDIGMACGRRVKPAVSPRKAIQRAILAAYAVAAAGQPGVRDPLETIGQTYDLSEPEESGVVRQVNNLITQALSQRATDIHIEPTENQVRVRFRVDGLLQEGHPFPKGALAPVLSRIKVMAGMDIAERRLPQDGRIEVELQGRRLDLRVNVVPTIYGEKVAIRILDRSAALMGLEELGMEPDTLRELRRMLVKPNGLLLVTGPTGSGKTTTLMAALTEINDATRQILTIEDPVEYHLPGVNQVQVNPKAGLTFAVGLRAFLRQDPDVLMVGEIRDGETADIAVRAALTGHLVISTLHTNSAAAAVARLVDMGVEPFLLASSLIGVLAQRLVRRLCPHCREAYRVDPEDPDFPLVESAGAADARFFRPVGCGHCDQTGYAGRLALTELLPVTGEVRRLIAAGATPAALRQTAAAAGMRSLWEDGLQKAMRGETTLEQVKRVALVEE